MSTVAEIDRLESELAVARAKLPSAVKSFYKFRLTRPVNSQVMVYAETREVAVEKVRARLDTEYPDGFWLHAAVDELDAETAALNCSFGSSLLDCLTAADATEFLADWRADSKLREVRADKRKSTLERDIEAYTLRKLAEADRR